MLAWKPDLYKWVATGEHNHPTDFEFPHAHYNDKGERIYHHHDGGDLDHNHGRPSRPPAAKPRAAARPA